MGDFCPRILQILRDMRFPGSEGFNEVDIKIFAKDKNVAIFMSKIADMDPGVFLSKEELLKLQLAGEMNNPSFVPIDPVAVRKEIEEIEQRERCLRFTRLSVKYKQAEIEELEKAIAILEEDKQVREAIAVEREAERARCERYVAIAEKSLKKVQQSAQHAVAKLVSDARSCSARMSDVLTKLRKNQGLRDLLDDEQYINVANHIVYHIEQFSKPPNQYKMDPSGFSVQLSDKGHVNIIAKLREASNRLDVWCNEILEFVQSNLNTCNGFSELTNTATSELETNFSENAAKNNFQRLERAVNNYRQSIHDGIESFILELHKSASSSTRSHYEQLCTMIHDLEVVVWTHCCLLREELSLLESCQDMLTSAEKWAQSIMIQGLKPFPASVANNPATYSSELSFFDKNEANVITPEETLTDSNLPSTLLRLCGRSCSVASGCSPCPKRRSPGASLSKNGDWLSLLSNVLAESSQVFAILEGSCYDFCSVVERLQADCAIFRGCSGVEMVSESARKQLDLLATRSNETKQVLRGLLEMHRTLLKDKELKNKAHRLRTLVPLFILDPEAYRRLREKFASGYIFEK